MIASLVGRMKHANARTMSIVVASVLVGAIVLNSVLTVTGTPLQSPVAVTVLALIRVAIVLFGLGMLIHVLRERQQAFDDMRALKEQAEEANRAKSNFLATMSHEIRTPMNAVLGMAELLQGTTLDARQQRYVDVVLRSGRALMSVIDDVLDFSQIEAGRIDLDIGPFDPRAMAFDIAANFRESAEAKGLTLRTAIDPSLPPTLLGDADRLRQVISNLVGNAIKFTMHGGVIIDVSIDRNSRTATTATGVAVDAERAVGLRCAVIDTGIGLSSDEAERLFQPFTQADASISRTYGGSGLGLAICRTLAHRMGGAVVLESQPGRGSTFVFDVPLSKPADSTSKTDADSDRSALGIAAHRDALRYVHVLLAEDNVVNQLVAAEVLEQLGCSHEAAADGFEVLAALERNCFDVILMDCMMPGMDGYEATRRIRARESARVGTSARGRLPIIALTADATADQAQRCTDAGMDDFLPKPYTVGALDDKIRKWVSVPPADVMWPAALQLPPPGERLKPVTIPPITR